MEVVPGRVLGGAVWTHWCWQAGWLKLPATLPPLVMTSHKPLQNSVLDSFTNRFPGQIRLGRLTANFTNATLPLLGGQVFNDAHIWPFTCVRVSSLASKVSLWGCGDLSLRRRTRKQLRIEKEKKKVKLAQFVRLLGKHEGIFQYKLSCWSLFFSGPESCEVLTVIIPSTSQRKL